LASEGVREPCIPLTDWKASALNQLFRELGVTGQPGRITAATVQHSQVSDGRVDSAGTDEQPMSRGEVTE